MSLDPERAKAPEPIRGLRRVHCGYHKSLTMYFRRVFERITRGRLGYGSFRHFQRRLEDFYRECGDYTFSSISGHAIFRFYELPFLARSRGLHFARKLSASRRLGEYGHIRDPRSGQWRDHVTPDLRKRFNAEYGGLLEKLGYPAD